MSFHGGTHPITVTVTDSNGILARASRVIVVDNVEPQAQPMGAGAGGPLVEVFCSADACASPINPRLSLPISSAFGWSMDASITPNDGLQIDDVSHEIGEGVDRFGSLDESLFSIVA